ncbi:hypothetical protein PRIPAC_77960 [Pristionchus pacificus]|uniref:Uncharacterized protein n=1 Tax=Pristionchus pacificus TaxID=54126 RepID=A0A2A6BXU4_PRIPA|nr:hypothetical protein PRIPAC_77960 [Pristionchus pacificus]|eukprot:PDM70725.1 hypothetical protein PRIPAC_44929 [Pristionchus pacificus]
MKTMSYRTSEPRPKSLSPQRTIRKEKAEERKEKKKVEATLRRLVGSSEDTDQCELIYQIMSYIKELQQQLNEEEPSSVPADLDALFSSFSTVEPPQPIESDKENATVPAKTV